MNRDPFNHMSDSDLLAKFYTEQDNKWLGVLLQRYTLLLLGVCMKYLKNEESSKDAVQQIFLKVLGELQKYKVEYFKSWLYMVARNHCLMQLRDKSGRMTRGINDTLHPAAEESLMDVHIEKDRMLNFIEQSLDELSAEQKTCVTLFYLQKKSYNDIIQTTGYSMMQVKSYIQNAKRNLKIMVEKKMKQ